MDENTRGVFGISIMQIKLKSIIIMKSEVRKLNIKVRKEIYEDYRVIAEINALAFLYGHPNYYPRFGYKTHMFGDCSIEILNSSINLEPAIIEEREVRLNDIEILMEMWKRWYGNIDLSLIPSKSILDWISHTVKIKTSVITINGEVKGYLRYDANNVRNIRLFLAKDKESAEQLVRYIVNKIDCEENIRLPIHPDSLAISMLSSFEYKVDIQKWDAGMIRILDEKCKEIIEYCDEVLVEKRKAGKIIFIPSYDMA